MKIKDIDNGTVTGLVESLPFVGLASGMLNNEQMISDTNTFIFTVKTNAVTSTVTTVQLPLMSVGTYNFWVDWGDGRKDYVTSFAQIYVRETVARTHTYRTAGTYTIKITGIIRGWTYYPNTGEEKKLISIERWGCLELRDDIANGQLLAGCSNLDLSNVKDTLRTTYLTSMNTLFAQIPKLKVNLLNNWNLSNITNIRGIFSNNTNFNDFIGNWDTSKVTNMNLLFSSVDAFNQDISNWDVSKVTTFNQTFTSCNEFNQPIGKWNTSSAIDMGFMFQGTVLFDQNLGNWDVSKVTAFTQMFYQCVFNNGGSSDINNWNINTVSNVSMNSMFQLNTVFNQPIGNWNTSRVTNMTGMFQQASFNQPIGNWNTSAVTNMASMFNINSNFNQDIGNWNIGAVTSISSFMSSKTPATFSTANLDAIYIGWSSRPSNSNLSISFGTANYTAAGAPGKAVLLSRGWTIVDGIEV